MCSRDFHLAGSCEQVQGFHLWRHVYATGRLVQVGWVEGRVVSTDSVQDVCAGGFGGVFSLGAFR